ncbi:MAG: DUF2339 domain-containing protein [Cyanobacteria bacterium]|nr:DUF2339 domain-containing protein [Cyanobacteriota bacterium]
MSHPSDPEFSNLSNGNDSPEDSLIKDTGVQNTLTHASLKTYQERLQALAKSIHQNTAELQKFNDELQSSMARLLRQSQHMSIAHQKSYQELLGLQQELTNILSHSPASKTSAPKTKATVSASTSSPVTTSAQDTKTGKPQENPSPQSPAASSTKVKPKEAEKAAGWEIAMGIKWFSRIGIVVLLIGFVMGLCWAIPSFPPVVKLLNGALMAFAFYWGGSRLRASMPVLGKVLQGGGFSIGYGTLFAACFIPGVQLFQEPLLGWGLLAGYVAFMMVVARRMQSQTVAILGLAFGYYTANYSEYQEIAFLSTLLLGGASLRLCLVNPQWQWLLRACFLGAFSTYLYWLGGDDLNGSALHHSSFGILRDQDLKSIYLWLNFALFHFSSVVLKKNQDWILMVFNTFVFYLLIKFSLPEAGLEDGKLEGLFALVQGLTFLRAERSLKEHPDALESNYQVVSQAAKPANKIVSHLSLIQGLLFVGLATMSAFSTESLPVILGAQALVLGYTGTKGIYPWTLKLTSVIFLGISALMLPFQIDNLTSAQMLCSVVGLALIGLAMERSVYRSWMVWFRILLMGAISLELLIVYGQVLGAWAHWVTLAWVLSGFMILASGIVFNAKIHRLTGLIWLVLAGGKLVLVDTSSLEMPYKIILYMGLGAGLLGASYAYSLIATKIQSSSQNPETPSISDASPPSS